MGVHMALSYPGARAVFLTSKFVSEIEDVAEEAVGSHAY
jgi:hypothetical protein